MKSKTLKKGSSTPEVMGLATAGPSRSAARTNAEALQLAILEGKNFEYLKDRKRHIHLPFISFTFALLLLVSVLTGCAGGDGGSSPAGVEGAGIPVGGGSPPAQEPVLPTVLSLSPEDGAADVPVDAVVKMTFSKAMDPTSFGTGLELPQGFRHSDDLFACDDPDCKIIRFTPGALFEYGTQYTLRLQIGASGVKDADGKNLAAEIAWSFDTVSAEAFVPDLGFKSVMIDGGGITDKFGNVIDDAGECTSIGVDSKGIIHITYLSVSDSNPKYAFCNPAEKDCGKQASWTIELIDTRGKDSRGLGRDINMVIDENDRLHVAYRDYYDCPNCAAANNDGIGVLIYAVKSDLGWKSVVVDDTTHGTTDMYIRVVAGRIHISYRSRDWFDNPAGIIPTALSYATCSQDQDCLIGLNWDIVDIEGGAEVGHNEFAGPSDLFVTESAVHISYRANGTLKYAACLLDNPDSCRNPADWENVVVDDGSGGSVGTDSSIFVNDSGVHITYRDNTNADIKYAFCSSASLSSTSCLGSGDWKTAAFDRRGDMGVCTRLRIDANGFHAVYADRTNRDVKYAFCRKGADCLKPENWTPYRIDAPGDVGWDAYLALDPDGKIHVSYRDSGNQALKYAWGEPPPIGE